MKIIAAIVSGRIQDVGYRAKVVAIAKELGLTGNIQNLEDGRVRIIAEGEEGALDGFLDAIRIKNTLINVGDVEIEYSGATGEYANFYKLVEGGETDGKLDKASEYLKELIAAVNGGFENLGSNMDVMIEKQDQTIWEMRTGFETLGSKQDQTTEEMRALRGDLNSYIGWSTEKLRSELKEEIRTEFNEIKRAMKAHELCADATG